MTCRGVSRNRGAEAAGHALVLTGALLLAITLSACHAAVPDTGQMTRDAHQLEGTFPALEALHVDNFRNQDWCQVLSYAAGSFATSSNPSTCVPSEATPTAFNAKASADFERVKRALGDTGVSIWAIEGIGYDAAGRLTHARFDVVAGVSDAFFYLFDRDNNISKDPNPDTIVTQKINADWWFLSEDWN